jgi:hypothetical protein
MHTENDVLVVEPGSHHRGDEELGSVGVAPGIGHRENASLSVLHVEVLIWEEGGKSYCRTESGASRVPTSKFFAID